MSRMVMDAVISVILLFLGIAVLVIIHVCIVGRLFREGHQSGVVGQRIATPSVSISSEDLKKLPCFDYVGGERGSHGTSTSHGHSSGSNGLPVECAVCLESFKVGEKCRLLPNCCHTFHVQCIDSWLFKTPACPICRTGVIVVDPPTSFKALVEENSGSTDAVVELT